MNERYIRWWTPHLSRDFEMLAFGDGGGLPLVLFPTSFGRHTQNKDFGLTDSIAWYVDSATQQTIVYANVSGSDGKTPGDNQLIEIHLQGVTSLVSADFQTGIAP